jgi:multidrug efflux pump
MKFTDLFIKRPVLAICVNLLILIAGFYSFQSLNVRQYPRSDNAVVTVKTAFVGANADLVRGFITTPLERVIASADGIDYLESNSAQGLSTITARLRLNFDINNALTQIQSKVAQVRNELPPEAEAPIIEVENADSQFASMYLSFYSEDLNQNQITDYLTRVVQPKISSIKGVQRADILGGRVIAMRIWLDGTKLAALNVTPSDVQKAIAANNFLSAVGQTKGSLITVNLVANTDLKSKEEFEHMVIRNKGNELIRLSDIATVSLGAESYEDDVRFDGQAATFMGIWVLPNSNAIDVIKDVRAIIPEIERNLPSGLKVGIPYDATSYIRDALYEVTKTLAETILIVVIVIFLFIGSFRAVLVPVVTIPLSLLGACIFMVLFGFTINLLTLLAIVLSVGLVVDDAIVMLENVERHIALGDAPIPAALKAARELIGPIIAMTITLATVYAPIGIQGGLTGTLFREFAFTLSGAVILSGVVALTLSPMMSSRLIREIDDKNKFKKKVDATFDYIRDKYETFLEKALKFRYGMVAGAAFFMLCLPIFYMFSMKVLAPNEDQGFIFGIVRASPNSALDQTVRYSGDLSKVFREFPEHAHTFQLINPTGGFSGMLLKPWSQRKRTSAEIAQEANGKFSNTPGISMFVTPPPPLPGGTNYPVEFVISSTNSPAEVGDFADRILQKALASGKFQFLDSDLKFDLPQSEIVIDRDKAATLGLNLQQVGRDLSTLTGGNYINRFNILGRSYKVIPQLLRNQRMNPDQLSDMYVTGPKNNMIPLSTFATLSGTVEPRTLNRFQQLNSAKLQGGQQFGVSLDQALKVLEDEAAAILPQGYAIDYAGEARQLRKEQSSMQTTLILAVILIFLVLAAQFESFRDPLIILGGSVPLALTSALGFVFLGFTSLNIYSQVGLVTLVGLVAKNGILIVEFANHLQEQGRAKLDAIKEACSTRLRPVLMTTVATVAGHFPLILASGAGAGSRNSIGIVLVTGMIIGTFFTLFLVPVIYLFVASEKSHAAVTDELAESTLA